MAHTHGVVLEATLRDDGSVAKVQCTGEPGDPGTFRPETSAPDGVFPLDGLPLTYPGETSPPLADGKSDTWCGGFAFAVWDREGQTLRAYRDHYGARPLYYHASRERLLLASEIPALVERLPNPGLDEIAVAEYLATGIPTEGRSFHKGILRLSPASVLTARRDGLSVERYWSPWTGAWMGSTRAEDLDEVFRHLLGRAVRTTLADRSPTGMLLSGGVDSSGVLGMAASLARSGAISRMPRVALTLAFEELTQCDETSLAMRTAAEHGVPWRPVRVEDTSPLSHLDSFMTRLGEPSIVTVNIAPATAIYAAAQEAGARVLLDGHDADGIFTPSGAYLAELVLRFRWVRLAQEWYALSRRHSQRRLVRECITPLIAKFLPMRPTRIPGWIRPELARRTGLRDRLRVHLPGALFEEREAERVHAAPVGLALEGTRTLERLFGVEGRHPYFDPAVVRFVVSVPLDHRFARGHTKIMMRRALGNLLPHDLRSAVPKTSYRPYFDWTLRKYLGPRLEVMYKDGVRSLGDYVEESRLRPMLADALQGRSVDPALWRIVAMDRWIRAVLNEERHHETVSA